MSAGISVGPFWLLLLLSPISVLASDQGGSGNALGSAPSSGLWCVAKNNAEDADLQSALDWACGPGGADCGPIQNNGPCYDGSDIQRTASYAFNDYYLRNGPSEEHCDFSNTAALTSLNPSHDKCKFPSSSSLGNGNFSGPVTLGFGSSDLSSTISVASHRGWVFLLAISAISVIL